MDELIIFTDSKNVVKSFSSVQKSRNWKLTAAPFSELKDRFRENVVSERLHLIDYASIEDKDKKKTINFILKQEDAAVGIIDRKGEISDPAELLMNGIDYFGNGMLREGIKPSRLARFMEFHSTFLEEPDFEEEEIREGCLPETSWGGHKKRKGI